MTLHFPAGARSIDTPDIVSLVGDGCLPVGLRARGQGVVRVDDGSLPEAIILDYVLAETLNGVPTHAGHDVAVDFLDRIEENARFHIQSLDNDTFSTGKALFRKQPPLSFVDACIVAYMQSEGIEYLYAFDDDFDAATGVTRLDTATNPYEPN